MGGLIQMLFFFFCVFDFVLNLTQFPPLSLLVTPHGRVSLSCLAI